jgi:hypothetical protein
MIAIKIGDCYRAGENACGIRNRSLERTIPIAEKHVRESHVRGGSRNNVRDTVAVHIGYCNTERLPGVVNYGFLECAVAVSE